MDHGVLRNHPTDIEHKAHWFHPTKALFTLKHVSQAGKGRVCAGMEHYLQQGQPKNHSICVLCTFVEMLKHMRVDEIDLGVLLRNLPADLEHKVHEFLSIEAVLALQRVSRAWKGRVRAGLQHYVWDLIQCAQVDDRHACKWLQGLADACSKLRVRIRSLHLVHTLDQLLYIFRLHFDPVSGLGTETYNGRS